MITERENELRTGVLRFENRELHLTSLGKGAVVTRLMPHFIEGNLDYPDQFALGFLGDALQFSGVEDGRFCFIERDSGREFKLKETWDDGKWALFTEELKPFAEGLRRSAARISDLYNREDCDDINEPAKRAVVFGREVLTESEKDYVYHYLRKH